MNRDEIENRIQSLVDDLIDDEVLPNCVVEGVSDYCVNACVVFKGCDMSAFYDGVIKLCKEMKE